MIKEIKHSVRISENEILKLNFCLYDVFVDVSISDGEESKVIVLNQDELLDICNTLKLLIDGEK